MPWDPAPSSIVPNPTPLPSNSARPQSQSLPASTAASVLPPMSTAPVGVQIKTEPGTGYNMQSLPSASVLTPNYGNQAALQRAGQHIQEKFGASASLQVNQLQARAAIAAQGSQVLARPHNQPAPSPPNEEQRRQLEQRRQQYALQHQRQQQQQYQNLQNLQQAQQRAASVNNAQTDGAADWSALVAQRRADAGSSSTGTYDADMNIRQQLLEISREMEGGGLMLPLSQHQTQRPSKRRRSGPTTSLCTNLISTEHQNANRVPTIPQFDGTDDTDEDDKIGIKDDPGVDDEDAINSDLDDPDEDAVDETEEDENNGEVMVCTYDKVQRVKNKWKCTLKDGVLTTGGREYVAQTTYNFSYGYEYSLKLDMCSTKLPASSSGKLVLNAMHSFRASSALPP